MSKPSIDGTIAEQRRDGLAPASVHPAQASPMLCPPHNERGPVADSAAVSAVAELAGASALACLPSLVYNPAE